MTDREKANAIRPALQAAFRSGYMQGRLDSQLFIEGTPGERMEQQVKRHYPSVVEENEPK